MKEKKIKRKYLKSSSVLSFIIIISWKDGMFDRVLKFLIKGLTFSFYSWVCI